MTIEEGLCQCGCGRLTSVSATLNRTYGYVAGQHKRFFNGHQKRKPGFPSGVTVDHSDADLSAESWVLGNVRQGSAYAYRSIYNSVTKKSKREALHRIIAARMIGRPLTSNEVVDHINGNGLDNRRDNLRVVSKAYNCANRQRHDRRNKSGFRGVWLDKRYGTYVAQATFNRRHVYLGSFNTAEEAAAVIHKWRTENMPGYIGEIAS